MWSVLLVLISATPIHATSLYWVGPSGGSWTDGNNWSFESGGKPAGVSPGTHDQVFISGKKEFSSFSIAFPKEVNVKSLFVSEGVEINSSTSGNINFNINNRIEINGIVNLPATTVWKFENNNEPQHYSCSRFLPGQIIITGGNVTAATDVFCTSVVIDRGKLILKNKNLAADDIVVNKRGEINASESNIIYKNSIAEDLANNLRAQNNEVMALRASANPCGAIPFTLTAVVTTNYNGWHTSCNDANDATICVNVAGGVGPFNYIWIGGGPATPCWAGVGAGNYLVVVFDVGQGNTPCNTSIVVNEPTPLTLFSWSGNNPSCNGACDGTATPIIIGGQPPYSYNWSTGETTPTASLLCVGQNTCTITDANGCSFDTTFFILTPTPVQPNVTTTDATCFGVCNGTADSDPSGGNGAPYTFSWNPGGATTDTISGLCAGNYTVTVLDQDGCIGTQMVTINEPIPITINLTGTTNLVCNGICSGSITVNPTNGLPPYSYQWFNATTGLPIGQTGATATGLCAGTYYVIVTDAGTCFIQSATFTVTQPTVVTATATSTNATCNNLCNGTLSSNPSGGVPGYTITWINAVTTLPIGNGSPLNNVCDGTYFAEVQDANGCIINTNIVVITEPPPLTLSVSDTDILCFGFCTGTGSSVPGGGTPGLTVTWHNSPSGTQVGAAGNNINNLCAGNYFATVTDANGCTLNSNVFAVIAPPPLVINSQSHTNVTCNGVCDGSVTFSVSGGTPNIGVQWFDLPGNNPVGLGGTLLGLCPGTYYAIATDANGCTIQSNNYLVTEPLPLSVTVDTVGTACGTNCNGMAIANVLGGTPVYTYQWFDAITALPIGQTGSTATSLCAGSYYVMVTDANGCQIQSVTVIILTNTIVDGTMIATNVDCNGFCDGGVDLTPNGGAIPYTYVWFDQVSGLPIGQSTQDANGLCAGDYYVVITDANLCSSVPLPVSITEPTAITAALNSTNIQCNGQCTGNITAVVGGGVPPYTLAWVNSVTGFPIGQTGLTASNLCAGSYELQITDANGCLHTSNPVVITEPTPIAGTLTSTNIACNSQCNALATYAIGGGTIPYTFTWSSSANTSSVETNLCAGTYAVSVTDANGCTLGPTMFIITEPVPFSATVIDGNVSCFGTCDGVVSVNALGGTGPYSYQWNDPGFQTTPVASGLCAGSFDVTIQDANNCNYGPFTANVTNSTLPSAVANATNTLCNGSCDGTATANPAGGLPPYTYQWNDPLNQTTQTASGLCAGNYTVTVTDANGCSTGAIPVTVNSPAAVTLVLNTTNVACNSLCTGAVTAVPGGGIAPYTFFWNTGSITPGINGLCVGTYTVIVTDANGCQQTQSASVIESSNITATFNTTSTACGLCTASATIIPAGGIPGYTYQWGPSAGNQTTQTANNLCAGAHQVVVTDNAGCTATFFAAISNPTGELAGTDSSNASCATVCNGTATVIFVCSDPPCTVLWNDLAAQTTTTATGLCPGIYTATITNNSGCVTSAQVTVDGPNTLNANVSSTHVLCNATCTGTGTSAPTGGTPPYSYLWNDPAAQTTSTIFNLCVGAFQVTVTDSAGCTANGTVNILEPNALIFSTSVSDATCNNQCNGSGNAFPSGGTAPYTYQWDDPSAQTTQSATGLCAGTYNVTIFDNNGCTSGPQTLTVNEPTAPVLDITSTNPTCNNICNGTASVTVSGGTPPYFYSWDDPFNQTTSTATNLCGGTYSVTVTDVAGCVLGIQTVTLSSPSAILVSLAPQSPLCNGSCNGIITASVSGGTSGYTLGWTPSGQTGFTATGLCAGNYSLTVTDANGCMVTADTTLINNPALQANLSITNASCSGQCDGLASVTPTGGTGALSIVWSPSNATTSSISALCWGNYSVSISDANGCSQNFPFAITEPAPLILVTGSSPSTCGVCNGAASVGPSGGTPPYTYLWDAGAASQTTFSATNLCAGIYDVVVTDALGCTGSATAGVSNFDAETLTLNITDATCPDVCNGSVTTASTCASGPCSFQWFDATGTSLGITTPNISNLCPSAHFVQLTNGAGCINLINFIIDSPDTIVVTETVAPPPCNGLCNTVISLNVTGGTPGYNFQWDAAAGNSTSPIVNNLCSGSYTVIVTDAIGCDDTITYTFVDPPALQITLSQSSVTCNGDCNGTATALVTGGTPGYTFTWNDPGSQTTPIATGLCGGNYALVVTDAAGCSVINGSVVVPEPALLTLLANGTAAICNSDCNGIATAIINGGVAPYSITWDDPGLQTTAAAMGLCAGTYNVNVTDSNNCAAGPVSVIITEPVQLTFTYLSTDALCNGICSGTITITAAGGNGGYLYSSDNGNTFQASNVFTNLCPGAYTILVVDGSGCTAIPQNVNINEPTALTSGFSTFQPPCGLNSGAITALPIGGTPLYTFNWLDAAANPIGQTTQTAINLPSGFYSVVITDANGCNTTVPVQLSNSNAPNVSFTSTAPVCNGDCTGSIDITAVGGTPGYTYLWIPNGQTTEDLINQCAGTYLVQVSDLNGCLRFQSITINEPGALTSIFALSASTCGLCDGSASVITTGGTSPLTYTWSNGQTGTSANNLCAGAYTVLVTDSLGCSNQFNTVIDNTGAPTVAVTVSNETCKGDCNGTATANAFGGAAPYTYLWLHDGSSSPTQSNLCSGPYIVQVSDSMGCVNTQLINISSPQPPLNDSIVVAPATCGVCDGSLSVFVTAGFPPFSFQWDAAAGGSTNFQVTNLCQGFYTVIITDALGCKDTSTAILNNDVATQVTLTLANVDCNGNCNGTANAAIVGNGPFTTVWQDATANPIGQTGVAANNLCAADYIVEITDAGNCVLSTAFTIDEPDPIQLSLAFEQDETCFNTCDGILVAMPINGTLPLTYAWNDPGLQTTPSATALCDGLYTVTITDANGCTAALTDTVFDPPAITIQFDSTDATCTSIANGAIDAIVAGGAGGFSYVWNGPNGFTAFTQDLSNIFFGTYVLTVTDANGCVFTDSVIVNALLIAIANAGPDTSYCSDGNQLTINGTGSPGVTFQWFNAAGSVIGNTAALTTTPALGLNTFVLVVDINGCTGSDTVIINYFPPPAADAGPDINILSGTTTTIGGSPTTGATNSVVWSPFVDLNDTTSFNPTASPDSTTIYSVTVTDANGCVARDTMAVIVLPDIIFPNGFSPNGDGDNDVWILDFISEFPDCEVEVYNRWGQPIFYSKGYQTPWNGTYNGNPVTIGTYYYIIKLNNPLYLEDFVGPLTILR